MAYADRDALVARFTEAEITALENLDAEALDPVSVSAKACSDATEEVNSYISVRYAIPLPSIPAVLVRATCDIARFRMYKDRPIDIAKYRYERTIRWLEHLVKGLVHLTFSTPLTEVQIALNTPRDPVATEYTGGVFSSEMLAGMVSMRPLR